MVFADTYSLLLLTERYKNNVDIYLLSESFEAIPNRTLSLLYDIRHMEVVGNYLIVFDYSGVRRINLANTSEVVEIGVTEGILFDLLCWLPDPTRGGFATSQNLIVADADVGIYVFNNWSGSSPSSSILRVAEG